jgi:hypothetical protein
VTVLCAVVAALTPRRRPGYPERLFGEAYRRVELKVAYVLRLTPLTAGAMMLGERVFGFEVARVGNLALVCIVSAILLVFLRLRPVATSQSEIASERRLPA